MILEFVLVFFSVIIVLCALIELRKWKLDKMVKNMSHSDQIPIFGVGHKFIGKDNEGRDAC